MKVDVCLLSLLEENRGKDGCEQMQGISTN